MLKPEEKESTFTLFTGGLHPKTTESDLFEILNQAGDPWILEIRLPKKKGKRIKSIAFIDIRNKETGDFIIKYFKNKKVILHDRRITFAFSNKSEADKQKKEKMRLFMPRIPKNVSDEIIMKVLKEKEKLDVRSAYQIFCPKGKPRGFGFIDFFQESHAKDLLKLGYFYLEGEIIVVEPYVPKSNFSTNCNGYYTKNSKNSKKKFYSEENHGIELYYKKNSGEKKSKKLLVETQKITENKRRKPDFKNPNIMNSDLEETPPTSFSQYSSYLEKIKNITSKSGFKLFGEIQTEKIKNYCDDDFRQETDNVEMMKIFNWKKIVNRLVNQVRLANKDHISIENYNLNKRDF